MKATAVGQTVNLICVLKKYANSYPGKSTVQFAYILYREITIISGKENRV